ncbi:Hemocyte protein-glutamine gamma-glutamyltransferase-like protein [Dinothrombium tinctorium]|uniref:Hemocyte protein-glutamine gamma-glutamyltransferase-like protein n=1 Tax=Dinothrombium tinctorium TaxID=1965070 RepID=A0A443RGD1_9ACAR|nr:Hemocyte protein-glutamine gamma-glutamyltransferase-like protein [Dinothrombium tinctorium]
MYNENDQSVVITASPNDDVYLDDEYELNEIVLNDEGEIWMGTDSGRFPKPWTYGQFDDPVLLVIVFMIEKYGLSPEIRADVVTLSRAFTSMVNSNDNLGVIVGRWDGKYSPYTSPLDWYSSVPIMKEYYESDGGSGRYAQCWVYAAMLNTICRGIGLPTRLVTTYGSAHDGNRNLVLDKLFRKGPYNTHVQYRAEMLGNFHAWNEVWMKRNDLLEKYSGWQVIDATPQELSNDYFRLGPTPIKRIKEGDIMQKFDSPFVYAEVNADVIHWENDVFTGKLIFLKREKASVGLAIITKDYRTKKRKSRGRYQEVTTLYKYEEQTPEERQSILNASKQLNLTHLFEEKATGRGIRDEIQIKMLDNMIRQPLIGRPLHINITLENKVPLDSKVSITVKVASVFYTGVSAKQIFYKPNKIINLKVGEKYVYQKTIRAKDYLNKLVEFEMVQIEAVVSSLSDQNAFWSEERTVEFKKPRLILRAKGVFRLHRYFKIEVYFRNPLPIKLTKCKLISYGQSMHNLREMSIDLIGGFKRVKFQRRFLPKTRGKSIILFILNCKELKDIIGRAIVEIY